MIKLYSLKHLFPFLAGTVCHSQFEPGNAVWLIVPVAFEQFVEQFSKFSVQTLNDLNFACNFSAVEGQEAQPAQTDHLKTAWIKPRRSQSPDVPLAASAARNVRGGLGGREVGSWLHCPTRGWAMKGLLASGAEVKEAAEAGAHCPLSLGRMLRWRAAALAGTQRFMLLQTAGRLDREAKPLV